MRLEAAIGAAFERACRDELEVPKPGNVHVFASGHAMTVEDFRLGARRAAPFIACRGARIGARIWGAVEASLEATRQNINLGIILLCAPLAAAAEKRDPNLRAAVRDVLAQLDREDARLAFEAIVRASPGGLGDAPRHDVRSPAAGVLAGGHGRSLVARPDRAPIRHLVCGYLRGRIAIVAALARTGRRHGARDARGVSGVPRELSRHACRAQARRARSPRASCRQRAPSSNACRRERGLPSCDPSSSPGMRRSSAPAPIPAPAPTSRSRRSSPQSYNPSCGGQGRVVDLKSGKIFRCYLANRSGVQPDAVNKDSSRAGRQMSVRLPRLCSPGRDIHGQDHQDVRRQVTRR